LRERAFLCPNRHYEPTNQSVVNHGDAEAVEQSLGSLRSTIVQAELPKNVHDAVRAAYADLGADVYVAVRSSGTAEDLAEASFAGMHDTILDVRGREALVHAIKECFASLFTSRAVVYRRRNGFDDPSIALVVQRMVASEAAGVMFTANPLTQATDEVVINSSWGLGESVVSSLVEPDLFILKAGKIRVREKKLGSKEFKIFRDPNAASGTVQTETKTQERDLYSLSDEQACKLARLGLRIQNYYDGLPQDIEWGYEAGAFYVLQSRPVTGIEFSWDVDCEDYQIYEHKDDVVWTRTQADESWSGAVSPLVSRVGTQFWSF
jgi:phosphoenolpyruvate synthase/pyruvate phosphate dikinase